MKKREPVTLAEWVKRYAEHKNPQMLTEIERQLRRAYPNLPRLSKDDRQMFIAAGFNHELLVEAEKLKTEKRPVLHPTFLKSFPLTWLWVNPKDIEVVKMNIPTHIVILGLNCNQLANDVPRDQRPPRMMY